MERELDPRRVTLGAYPFVREITPRAGDMDGYGHLNAVRIGQYYEDARAAFYVETLRSRNSSRLLVAQITLRYLAEGFWPDPVQVGTGFSQLGTTSCRMAQGLFQGGRCIGLCDTVLVNTFEGRSAPLSGELRRAFAAALLAEAPVLVS